MDDSPLPPQPWVYKPGAWDHEELHRAYPLELEPEAPPDSIEVTLLDAKGQKMPPIGLTIDKQRKAFQLGEYHSEIIPFVNLRCMSTNCKELCRDHVADHRFIIMLSIRFWEDMDPPEDFEIRNLFVQPESAENALAIMNFLRYHVFQYLKKETEEEDPTSVLEFICPQILQKCTATVHWRRFRKTWIEKRTVVLDPECVIFYREPFEDAHKPRDRLFLWLEQYRKTVNKVSRIKSENCILLHSLYMYVKLEYDENTGPEIEAAFLQVKPLPKRALVEPKICFHWLAGNYDPIKGEIIPPKPVIPPVDLDEDQTEKMDQFERQLEDGWDCRADDYSHIIWENMRPVLENIIINDRLHELPEVNDEEWEISPNSVDSLLEVINLIETELFLNVNFEKALATTVAMKKAFKDSAVERMRKFLENEPVDILHKIHARGNIISQPSMATGRPNLMTPPEEDAFTVDHEEDLEEEEEEEEEEDEDMEGVIEFQAVL